METIATLSQRLLGRERVRKHSAYGAGRTIIRVKRERRYGEPETLTIDRNLRVRLWVAAKAYNAAEKAKGEHGGPLTHAMLRVFGELLFYFAGKRGCWPAYEQIAAKAGVARSTVALAIRALENAGFIRVINRIVRVDHWMTDMFGRRARITAIERLSNSYVLCWQHKSASNASFVSKSDSRPEPKGSYITNYLQKAHQTILPQKISQSEEQKQATAINKAAERAQKEGGEWTDYIDKWTG
jgi:hypothetical protein